MPTLSDFRLGADVVAGDGRKAGTLASVLVEKQGFEPRAIVVKDDVSLVGRLMGDEKLLITDEVVIPIAAVESATRDLVRLSMSASDVRRQPPYLSYRLEPQTPEDAVLEEASFLGGGLGLPKADEIANKAQDQIEIDKDENVMLGKSGHRLGRVKELLIDRGELIAVVVRPDGFFKKDVVLPIRFVSRADDLALFADLDESDLEKLQPFDAG